eukprot:scaffold1243_cov118-Isochrysis_galbana.AAC.2
MSSWIGSGRSCRGAIVTLRARVEFCFFFRRQQKKLIFFLAARGKEARAPQPQAHQNAPSGSGSTPQRTTADGTTHDKATPSEHGRRLQTEKQRNQGNEQRNRVRQPLPPKSKQLVFGDKQEAEYQHGTC